MAGGGPVREPPTESSGENPKKNDDDKIPSILAKYLMWFAFFWLIVNLGQMVTPDNMQREVSEDMYLKLSVGLLFRLKAD